MTGKLRLQFCTTLVLCFLTFSSLTNISKKGVFSEMYYQNGWKATIDGKEALIYRTNYALRGLLIPAGKHTIEFTFDPPVVKTGSTIALISSIGMLLLVLGGLFFERKNKETKLKMQE